MERLLSANMGIPLILNAFAMLVIKLRLTQAYDGSDGLIWGVYLSNRIKMILFHPPLTKKIKTMFIPKHTVILISTMHLCIVLIAVSLVLWQYVSDVFAFVRTYLALIMSGAFFLEMILLGTDMGGYPFKKEKKLRERSHKADENDAGGK